MSESKTTKIDLSALTRALAFAELTPKVRKECFWPQDWSDRERLRYKEIAQYLKRVFKI